MNTIDINNQDSPLSKQKVDFYIVATPIGNFADITIRALETLKSVDIILCEDTRVTGKLLAHYSIKSKTVCYNDFSEDRDRRKIISQLQNGQKIALVSDAGTPLVSDPGYKLVREISQKGFTITSLPGASSTINALVLSGLPSDKFLFAGFLPPKQNARITALKEIKDVKATLIFFESARRLTKCLTDMQEVLGDREATVTREMTKHYEEIKTNNISKLIEYYEATPAKGEVVLTVSSLGAKKIDAADIEQQLIEAMKNMRVKDAASVVAENTGQSKKDIYKLALEIGKRESD